MIHSNLIYRLIKPLIKVALFVFFKKMVVTGKERIPIKGPLIIAANHPNTFMDPLIVASITKQQVGFIGNAGIFVNKLFNKVLYYFNVIPIYRKKDIKPDEKPDNRASFAACHEYLNNGGTILVFPEGSSYYELKLREIKTGTARIALSYEQLHEYKGNLLITPISLDYSDSLQFRSMLSVNVGKSISVKDFEKSYEKDEIVGVNGLTEAIRLSVASRIPNTIDKDQETFLVNVHRFYTSYCEPEADLYANPKASLALRSILSKIMRNLQDLDASLYWNIQLQVDRFYTTLEKESVTSGFFTSNFTNKNIFGVYLGYFLTFTVLLPAYLIGLICNYIPYILPDKIFKLLKIDIEYKTSVALVAGLILFPFCYTLELILFRHFIGKNLLLSISFILFLPISGYLAMYYWTNLKRFTRLVRFTFKMKKERKMELNQLRDDIIKHIQKARGILDL